MLKDIPIIWPLLIFNGLFIGIFLYQRVNGKRRLPGFITVTLQTFFIIANGLILFWHETHRYLGWLLAAS